MSNPFHTFYFLDGRSAVVRLAQGEQRGTGWRQSSIDMIVGVDADGALIAADPDASDFLYVLTECCGGSFKGLEDYVGCRACYREVEGSGMPWGEITPRVFSPTSIAIVHPESFTDEAVAKRAESNRKYREFEARVMANTFGS